MPYRPHIFADNPLDRGDRERRDETWLAHKVMDSDTRILVMPELDVPLTDEEEVGLSWMSPRDLTWFGIEGDPVFLGLKDGVAHFAILVPASSGAAARLRNDPSIRFVDARTAAPIVSGSESGIIAQARAQLDWHNRHGFCSVCGERTAMGRGGHVRRCIGCKAEHFPRTDPVAIMLVHDGDRCLMGAVEGTSVAHEDVLGARGVHGPGRVHRGGSRAGGSRGGGDRGQERALSLVAAVAVSVIADDRMPC